jgi:hypothetical protein
MLRFARFLRRACGMRFCDQEAAERIFREAKEAGELGYLSLTFGMGGACSVNFHMCIDKCCGSIYSLLAEIPVGFGNNAGRNLLDLCDSRTPKKAGLSSGTLDAMKAVARIGVNFGSSAMYGIPHHKLSDITFLQQMCAAAMESLHLTEQILESLATPDGIKRIQK